MQRSTRIAAAVTVAAAVVALPGIAEASFRGAAVATAPISTAVVSAPSALRQTSCDWNGLERTATVSWNAPAFTASRYDVVVRGLLSNASYSAPGGATSVSFPVSLWTNYTVTVTVRAGTWSASGSTSASCGLLN